MNVIECRGLSKRFGRTVALHDLSFSIKENTITGLVGPNGAGKTTLLKIAAGFLRKTAGEIKVFSSPPFNNLKVSANTFFVDDNMALPATLNLSETLDAARRFYPNWDHRLALRLFDYFSLNPRQLHKNLSKGMKSTFNMIVGLSARCALTIFDEPTVGMDAAVRKDFYRALLQDYLQHPRTIIFSSHLLKEIEDILEEVLLLREGQKRLHLPADHLREYAVGLRGEEDTVKRFTAGKEIYRREQFGKNSIFAAVRNSFTKTELQEACAAGLEVLPVSAEDLCIYLTSRSRGGIDDVFNRN
ncbi:MAG: ABC transporter ATP-binding protein [Dethiobacteria bacterium]